MAEYIIEDNGWIENGGYIRPAPSGWLPPKPIVRCRDCKSWSGPCEIRPDGIEGVCDGWSATGNVVLTREDDFCSYGARREEER